jgi:hypothetical protein
MPFDTLQFVVVLYPDPYVETHWLAIVICDEGPTALLAAKPYKAALAAAQRELDNMLRTQRGEQAVIWGVETTPGIGEQLIASDTRALFRRLPHLSGKGTTVNRREITIR